MTDKDILDLVSIKSAPWKPYCGQLAEKAIDELIQEVEKLRARNNGWMEESVLYLEEIDSLTKENAELKAKKYKLDTSSHWKSTDQDEEIKSLKAKLEESQDELKEFKLAHEYCHLHGDDL